MKPSGPATVLEKALKTISRYRMLAQGDRAIAAVSGGPDSMYLLRVLSELAPRFGARLAGVAHLNHKLRGAESDKDERFVAQAAAGYGIPFYCVEASILGQAGNLEQAARRARLDFFHKLIHERAVERIATGHTLDDQAETVLFRLLRGAGPTGMAGILPVTREGLIRPLIETGRAEIERYLASNEIESREDASNRDLKFSRNRIRHGLLPLLKREWNPRVSRALAHAAEIAREEEVWWEGEIGRIADTVLTSVNGAIETRADKIAALPKAVRRRLIRRIAPCLDFEQVERVLELAERTRGEGRLDFRGIAVQRSFDWIRFEKGQPEASAPACHPILDIPGRYAWPGGYICVDVSESLAENANCASLKLRGISELSPLELRTWRAGDHYHPARGHRVYAIQELFQRARVPSWRRHVWPIVSAGPKILWVSQFGAAAEFAAQNEGGPVLRIWEESEMNAPAGESPRPGLAS
ncbi:MAG TPA: tRNA lysidine(34) synthetase TilS [Bryobacteraceae bacterium]|jgi:tRNA(Ile)-lysidine synthase